MGFGDRYIFWGGQRKGHSSHEFTLEDLKKALSTHFKVEKILGIFNLLNKYEINSVKKREEFIKLQIEYAQKEEYINNSQDFFYCKKVTFKKNYFS
jgi:hypothetical protein